MKVFVTGAGALLGQGIIRALKASPTDVQIAAADPSPFAPGLYWSDERYLIPMAKDETYMARIRDVLDKSRPDAVLIGTDVELPLFAEHRASLEAEFKTHVIVSAPRVVRLADDKFETAEFLREAGFQFPLSCLPGEEDALIDRVGFPLIIKPRHGARSVGLHLVDTRDQLDRLLPTVDQPVIQEHIGRPDEEYTAGVLCFDGRVDGSIVMRRELRDGNTYRATVEPYEHLNEQVQEIARVLKPHGPANLQFRMKDDRICIFEINARFSGTTPLRHRAGFREVDRCLECLVNGRRIEPAVIEPMVLLRHWSETVVHPSELVRP